MSSSQTSEKATNFTWVLRSIPILVHWWFFKTLMIGALLSVLIIWGIDGLNINTFLSKDFALFKLSNSEILSQTHNKDSIFTNLSFEPYSKSHQQIDLNQTKLSNSEILSQSHNKDSIFTNISITPNSKNHQQIDLNQTHLPLNVSQNVSSYIPQVPPNSTLIPWISAELESNYSSNILAKWLTPGGSPCKDSKTVDIRVHKLDGANSENIVLSTGDIHEFVFQTLDDLGNPHCLSGDYFEIDLSGDNWKSRPPIKDLSNGTYAFSLQVHPDFPGNYNLTIILLFRNYEGLKFSPTRFALDKMLRVIPITFRKSATSLPEIAQCEKVDYNKDVWSGRWTRHAKNDSCPISNDGRYRCQEPNFPCRAPWCNGPLGSLESNGWVYSSHCSFELFTSKKAWDCLKGRWIFWWGDSNHCDTIRNLLNFILDVHDVPVVPRYFDKNITNPADPTQTVRFTSIFNGHPNDTGNYQGLNSLINPDYRNLLKGYFSGNVVPDTIIMNSGLHDGVFWPNIRSFVKGADFAAEFWAEVIGGVVKRGLLRPEVIYRTTVATGGYARKLAFNPAKMEAFNGVVLDKLRGYWVLNRVIDDFDMTYPWHYDNRCNDGVHYGRAPLKMKWKDGGIGHQYFVDLMLCHVLMNALCTQ